MSRRTIRSELIDPKTGELMLVNIIAGYDRPLGGFFLTVETRPKGYILHDNEMEFTPFTFSSSNGTIDELIVKAGEDLGCPLELPEEFISLVKSDGPGSIPDDDLDQRVSVFEMGL